MFNVLQTWPSGETAIMLGCWCDEFTAQKWCQYYLDRYPVGRPYPNGKGFYTGTFKVISKLN